MFIKAIYLIIALKPDVVCGEISPEAFEQVTGGSATGGLPGTGTGYSQRGGAQ